MNETQKDQIRYELLRTIGALQDAFAYVQHAEQLAREYNAGAERMKISDLCRQINNAVTHAAIIRQNINGCKPKRD